MSEAGGKVKNIFQPLKVGELARRHPLTYFDIGSRGGFQPDLQPLAFAVDAVGFEPDPRAFENLMSLPSRPWRSVKHLPYGISDSGGDRVLHIPEDPAGASLLQHDPTLGERFGMAHLFNIVRTETVETRSLKEAVADAGHARVDYLKLDVEGAELSILESSPAIVGELLAVKTEVAFVPPRIDQPLASDVEAFMRARGFQLMAIIEPAHWRRVSGPVDPFVGAGDPPYAKGQIIHADYLFMRAAASVEDDVPKAIRLALLNMAFGYFDHALEILDGPAISCHLGEQFGCTPMEMVAPASRAYGRRRFLRAFRQQLRGVVPFVRHLKNIFK